MTAPNTAQAWRERAGALRAEQRVIEADAAMAEAVALAPQDPLIAFLHAQSRFELGLPAAALFARAERLWPENKDVTRNHALALAAQGDEAGAQALLAQALASAPDWIDGHRVLAGMRFTAGDTRQFDASLAAAARAHPGHAPLWLAWFSAIAQTRDWPRAHAILAEAAPHIPAAALAPAWLFLAGESGDRATAGRLLATRTTPDDAFIAMARIRYHLRMADPAGALAAALPFTQMPIAGQVWPYVSTCWRLLGDPRAAWLDGAPPYVGLTQVDLAPDELATLATLLRRLHTMRAPYADQSVRAGTQTDRSVLLRHEPILQRARAALMAAVRGFVDSLPAHDAAHPLLSRPREALKIAGSWSVRLGAGGYNVAHSHPLGWLSSAFYVSLPPAETMGPAPAGSLQLGMPPAELGLDLAPLATIAPVAGQMVLFPSTVWHGTHPIAGGERLNIAFDIVPG